MRQLLSSWAPLITALCLLGLSVFGAWSLAMTRTDGRLVYPLDDPYIHMAMARNLADHGIWGVTREGFSNASSSPLWVLLLAAGYALAGSSDVLPLVLNILFAVLVSLAADRLLRRLGLGGWVRLLVLLAVVVWTSLPPLVMTGHEHTLQLLTSLLFAWCLAVQLEGTGTGRRGLLGLGCLAALVVMTRYEGLFLVASGCGLLVLRRRLRQALVVGAAALAPVVAFGLYSLSRGWLFLPNSVLTKGSLPAFTSAPRLVRALGYQAIEATIHNPHMLVLLLSAAVLLVVELRDPNRLWRSTTTLALLFVATSLLHLQFARTSSFYRYEAWLVGLGLVAISGLASRRLTPAGWPGRSAATWLRMGAWVVLLVLVAAPLTRRSSRALRELPLACGNVYEQQIQMARFVAQYYQGQAVALNDIGAVNWYADIRCTDIWGLASMSGARVQLEHRFTVPVMSELAQEKGARVALTYFPLGPPWIEVGRWRISQNVVCASPEVLFFGLDEPAATRLRSELERFTPLLPPGVEHELTQSQ